LRYRKNKELIPVQSFLMHNPIHSDVEPASDNHSGASGELEILTTAPSSMTENYVDQKHNPAGRKTPTTVEKLTESMFNIPRSSDGNWTEYDVKDELPSQYFLSTPNLAQGGTFDPEPEGPTFNIKPSLSNDEDNDSISEGPNEKTDLNTNAKKGKRPHILILYTGGTIGMVSTKHGYAPKKGYFTKMVPDILRVEEERSGRRETAWRCIPTFDVIEYEPLLDSSNMGPTNWQRIAKNIYDMYESADGFIVIHGTDTMTYTASALSFLLQNLSKPVILTGAQVPLCELRTDAHSNLIGALQIASLPPEKAINEVTILFNGILLRGNRSNKSSSDSMEGFSSPTYPPLAELGINITTFEDRWLCPSRGPLRLHELSQAEDEVGVIRLWPGITGSDMEILLAPPLKAAIIMSFGIGNGPSDERVLQPIREAYERGVVLMNISQCPEGSACEGFDSKNSFQSGWLLTQNGVLSGRGMTLESCYVKLLFLLGKSPPLAPERIRLLMTKDYAGEINMNDETLYTYTTYNEK